MRAAACAAAILMTDASTVHAQTWELPTVLEPPALAHVDPTDAMGFGSAVSVGSTSWLVVGAPGAAQRVQSSVEMFCLDPTTPLAPRRLFLLQRQGV